MHFKRESHFNQSKESLDVDEDSLLVLCKYRPKLNVEYPDHANHEMKCYQKPCSNEGGILAALQVM